MYFNAEQIITAIYAHFNNSCINGVIPINLRAPSLVGTVQDDPFDCMIESEIRYAFPELEVTSSGPLTTPDIIIRDRTTGVIVGIEVKKLIQKPNGSDSRGLTMDYNSCLPCGTALIKVGDITTEIPCYYFFALLNTNSSAIVTLILMHGDFINYDFNLHKQAKVSNITEYGHGPYGEGSVRRRAMYTYPNPLNSRLECFFHKKTLVLKYNHGVNLGLNNHVIYRIDRFDIYGNSFSYSLIELGRVSYPISPEIISDIFHDCKVRVPRVRTSAAMPLLSE
ncbi:hypothetical protein ACTG2T_05830 [Aeromonas sp. 75A]|uniref:hypothetical protein n=1 Tax=unclassified Aeromonas TaxID=257493 RepID=UPI002E7BB38A|nr:hypothetical protein [Aeromonas sp. 43P]MEE1953580.1 hypothetical protein [Aeromonas sp. 43P]